MNREQPAAGWYPDPSDTSRSRWWDGDRWTEATRARVRAVSDGQSPIVPTADTGRTLSVDRLRTTSLHELRAVVEGRTGDHVPVRHAADGGAAEQERRQAGTFGAGAPATVVRSRNEPDRERAHPLEGPRGDHPSPFAASAAPAAAQARARRSWVRRVLAVAAQAAFVLAAIVGWVVVLGRLVG